MVGLPTVNEEAFSCFHAAVEKAGLNNPGQPLNRAIDSDRAALEEALSLSARAVDLVPLFIEAHIAHAQILECLGKKEECLDALIYLMKMFPQLDLVREKVALKMIDATGDMERALQIIGEGVLRNPLYPGYHILLAEIDVKSAGRSAAIFDTIEKVLLFPRLTPEDLFRISYLCMIAAEPGQLDRPAHLLIETGRKSPETLQYALVEALREKEPESLTALFSHAASLPDAGFEMKFAAAKLFISLEEKEKANSLIKRLRLEARSESEEAHAVTILEAHYEYISGRPSEALRLYLQELDSRPASLDALQGLLLIHQVHPDAVKRETVRARIEKALDQPGLPAVIRRELARVLGDLPGEKEKPVNLPPPPP